MDEQNKDNSVKTIDDLGLDMTDDEKEYIDKHLKGDEDIGEAFKKLAKIGSNAKNKIEEQGMELGFLRKKKNKLDEALRNAQNQDSKDDTKEVDEKDSDDIDDTPSDELVDTIVEKMQKPINQVEQRIDALNERLSKSEQLAKQQASVQNMARKKQIIETGLAEIESALGPEVANQLVDKNSSNPSDSPLIQILASNDMAALWQAEGTDPVYLAAKMLLPAKQVAKLEAHRQSETAGRSVGVDEKSDAADKFFDGMPEQVKL